MRIFLLSTLMFMLSALPTPTFAQSFDAKVEGAFQIETVNSRADCTALCENAELCRGTILYETTTEMSGLVTKELECRLFDGLTPGSPYAIKRPDLSLTTALDDLNTYRAQYGLAPVVLNAKLIKASEVHAEDMAAHGIMAHEGTDGSSHSDRAQRQNYYYSIVAENVAAGQKSWEAVFKAWQLSPSHNENLLLEQAADFGVALVYHPETQFATYWTMLMGREQQDFRHLEGAITTEQLILLNN